VPLDVRHAFRSNDIRFFGVRSLGLGAPDVTGKRAWAEECRNRPRKSFRFAGKSAKNLPMLESTPEYYSSLEPFREHFAAGTPILMYHKIGTRPSGARFRGLYLSPRLFATQMRELKAAGFQSITLSQAVQPSRPKLSLVLTFDDGFKNVLHNAVEPMRELGFAAIEFIVTNLMGKLNEWDLRDGEVPERLMDESEVRDWLAAGHEIGSHTRSHCRLTRLSLRDASEEITASKKRLEDTFGVPIRHFCYPYGDTNPAVEDLVAQAGYETACTTLTGVNTPETPPFGLKRYLARYPSRRIKNLRDGLALWRSK
jgi:peptidoglycan/xylan/chitin deacetylase (PgdA/CDA1 family)